MVVENEPPYRGGRYLLFVELGERITGNNPSRSRPWPSAVSLSSH